MLWDGYKPEEATWESEDDITSTAIKSMLQLILVNKNACCIYCMPYRCYNNQRRVVLDHVSDFISSISKSLKCGTIPNFV